MSDKKENRIIVVTKQGFQIEGTPIVNLREEMLDKRGLIAEEGCTYINSNAQVVEIKDDNIALVIAGDAPGTADIFNPFTMLADKEVADADAPSSE